MGMMGMAMMAIKAKQEKDKQDQARQQSSQEPVAGGGLGYGGLMSAQQAQPMSVYQQPVTQPSVGNVQADPYGAPVGAMGMPVGAPVQRQQPDMGLMRDQSEIYSGGQYGWR